MKTKYHPSKEELSGLESDKLILRVEATNKSQSNLKLKLQFTPNDDNQVRLPRELNDIIAADTTSTICSLLVNNDKSTIVPLTFSIDVSTQSYTGTDFTMSNFASFTDKPIIKKEDNKKESKADAFVKSVRDQRRNAVQIEQPAQEVPHKEDVATEPMN